MNDITTALSIFEEAKTRFLSLYQGTNEVTPQPLSEDARKPFWQFQEKMTDLVDALFTLRLQKNYHCCFIIYRAIMEYWLKYSYLVIKYALFDDIDVIERYSVHLRAHDYGELNFRFEKGEGNEEPKERIKERFFANQNISDQSVLNRAEKEFGFATLSTKLTDLVKDLPGYGEGEEWHKYYRTRIVHFSVTSAYIHGGPIAVIDSDKQSDENKEQVLAEYIYEGTSMWLDMTLKFFLFYCKSEKERIDLSELGGTYKDRLEEVLIDGMK
ncbi:hypothetical protein FHW36_105468 [Chitinophaga polysaccharea]|uniref:Uncharacterized protein n=1 Tax=Chitinophaga polysaccharea TaxID=1293035 RepID=A0A561PPI8_9BACT|nr:DUF5677 domain-containing protein [Chitinophaga polysaccharea]TWF40027.1 hypothetical protein FHW36_105468 [Chitinophaga polysaccharea]